MRHALAGSPTAPSPLMRGPDQSVMLATILDVEREEKPSVAFSIFGTRHGRVDAYSVAIAMTSDALSAEESLAGGGSSPPKTASVGHSSSVSASSSVPISQLRRERVWGQLCGWAQGYDKGVHGPEPRTCVWLFGVGWS